MEQKINSQVQLRGGRLTQHRPSRMQRAAGGYRRSARGAYRPAFQMFCAPPLGLNLKLEIRTM